MIIFLISLLNALRQPYMTYNNILKILMVRYDKKRADTVASMISTDIGYEVKKRKINAYTSSPDNRRFQKCPKEHLIAFANALKNESLIRSEDYQAITNFSDNQLFEHFEQHDSST